METKDYETKGYDTSITYEYKEMPDVRAGRCDNCDYTFIRCLKVRSSTGSFFESADVAE